MEFSELGIKFDQSKPYDSVICPECNNSREKHKGQLCLGVYNDPNNRHFRCHHCGWSGNLDIMSKYDEVRKNARMPKHIGPERAYSLEFTKFLQGRGFTTKTLTAMGIYESSNGVIGFPFYHGFTLVNVKFFNPDPKPGKPSWWQLNSKYGTKVCFMGMQQLVIDRADPHERKEPNVIIITEGEWDMLTWKEAGYKNVLSVPMGAPGEKAKNFVKEFQYINNDQHFLTLAKLVDTFYISVDADGPGVILKEHLCKLLGPSRCKIITYPEKYKDINDVLKGNKKLKLPALGKDKVHELYREAKFYPIKGIITADQFKDELRVFRNEGLQPGYGIGVDEINHLFTVKRKHISFWVGIPGMGKSVFLRWYLTELLKHNPDENMKFAMFIPEMRPPSREIVKLAEVLLGKRYQQGHADSMTDKEVVDIERLIKKHFIIISPDRFNYENFEGSVRKDNVNTMQSIFKYIAHLAKTENIFGYVIDAFNKLEFEHPSHVSETKFISENLDYMIDFNTELNVHGFIVVHPSKTSKDKNGNYIIPSLYDAKGSSAWHEKADIGLILHRYKYMIDEEAKEGDEDLQYKARKYTPLYVKAEKLRFEELGNIGIMRMDIDKYSRFSIHPDDKDKHLEHVNESEVDISQTTMTWPDEEDDVPSTKTDDLPF